FGIEGPVPSPTPPKKMGTLLSGERAHVCLLRGSRWRTAWPREHAFNVPWAPTRRRLFASVESLRTQTGPRLGRSPRGGRPHTVGPSGRDTAGRARPAGLDRSRIRPGSV